MATITVDNIDEGKEPVDIEATKVKNDRSKLVSVRTRKIYTLVNKFVGPMGADGANGPIYGELSIGSMQSVLQSLELGSDSTFLDIGAGLGKPNLHAKAEFGVRMSIGIEVVGNRWWQSVSLLKNIRLVDYKDGGENGLDGVFFAHMDATELTHVTGVTHVYSFSLGMQFETKMAICESIRRSHTVKTFACFECSRKMQEYGKFMDEFELHTTVSTIMSGSREGHQCYVYRRRTNDGMPQQLVSFIEDVVNYAPDDGYLHAHAYTDIGPFKQGGSVYTDWLRDQEQQSRQRKRARVN